MKKILGYSLLTAACVLMSGCVSAHAEDNKPTDWYFDENLTIKSGYYTCEEDDSYIHIDGSMIERCNFDYAEEAEKVWSELMEECDELERERQAPFHDTFIENAIKDGSEFGELQEYVAYTFPWSTYYPEKSDKTLLVLNFEFACENNVYTGYAYNEDGSIDYGYTYYYAGEELPEKAD